MELGFDGGKIAKDISVVELKIVQDHRTRAIVHELGTLVAESGVVLVGLDDEEGRILEIAMQPRRDTEVTRHAANKKARRQTGVFQNPGQQ